MKIAPYSFELHRFKVGAFFLRHSVLSRYCPLSLSGARLGWITPQAVDENKERRQYFFTIS